MKAVHNAEHRKMLEFASTIHAKAAGRQACEPGELAKLRLTFARMVKTHCEEEGRTIREAVRAGVVCPRTAADIQRELQGWRASLASLNSDWPSLRADSEPRRFASAFQRLADDLVRYIKLEEDQILDKIQDFG